jgi:hypothetical protein
MLSNTIGEDMIPRKRNSVFIITWKNSEGEVLDTLECIAISREAAFGIAVAIQKAHHIEIQPYVNLKSKIA